MARRPMFAGLLLALGLVLIFAYSGTGVAPAPDVGVALAAVDTATNTPTATTTLTPTATNTPTATATLGPPNAISLGLSLNPIVCGTTIVVTATVTTSLGQPVINGTLVQFSSSLGGLASSNTIGGVASATLTAPLNFSGSIVVQASSGNASQQVVVSVSCASNIPAFIVLSAPGTVSCGSTSQIVASVSDSSGRPVVDGTLVVFSASNGTVSQSVGTIGGVASAILSEPLGVSGNITIQASSGNITRQAIIAVVCTTAPTVAPTAVPPTTAPSSQVAGAPRLPSAGGGAGPVKNAGLLYGGIALIAASILLFGSSVAPARRRR
jgi:hypothetical protein